MSTEQAPAWRADIKGQVKEIKQECTDSFAGEMEHSENFSFTPECCPETFAEYSKYLTLSELKSCFNKAARGDV
jgi:hypothetical protein